MTITRITTKKYPDMTVHTVIFDSKDRRPKDIYKRIDEVNEFIDRKIDRLSIKLCDIIG